MTIQIVSSETNEPIPYASIMGYGIDGSYTGLGESTNSNGVANIDYISWKNKGVDTIKVSSSGYFSIETDFVNLDNIIDLEPNLGGLGDVIITGIRKNKYWIAVILIVVIIIIAIVASKNSK